MPLRHGCVLHPAFALPRDAAPWAYSPWVRTRVVVSHAAGAPWIPPTSCTPWPASRATSRSTCMIKIDLRITMWRVAGASWIPPTSCTSWPASRAPAAAAARAPSATSLACRCVHGQLCGNILGLRCSLVIFSLPMQTSNLAHQEGCVCGGGFCLQQRYIVERETVHLRNPDEFSG